MQPTPPVASLPDASAVADSERSASAPSVDRCADPLDPRARGCNPPAPDARVARAVDGEVMQQQQLERGRMFVVRLDADVGARRDWKTTFISDRGPIDGTEFEIVRVEKRQLTGVLANRTELPSKRVRVMEPTQ